MPVPPAVDQPIGSDAGAHIDSHPALRDPSLDSFDSSDDGGDGAPAVAPPSTSGRTGNGAASARARRRARRPALDAAAIASKPLQLQQQQGQPPLEDLSHLSAPELFSRIMNPVVKVYCRHTEPDFALPWQRQRQVSSTSSGFAVSWPGGDRWLLTNAHSVEYQSQVRVKRRGDDRKYGARVLAVAAECDLALLTVDDAAFWEGVKPLPLGPPTPDLQASVAVLGYPVGGDTVSVTAGVVSRIEVTGYVHGATQLLGVQIDAAINSGNSGGPVVDEGGRLVGVAFQSYAGSEIENVGWVIPGAVLSHFLSDYATNGHYTGFPVLGVQWQRLESEALKRQLKMEPHHTGVLATYVAATSAASQVLRRGDVLMVFDGSPIASDGTASFRTGERILFSYLVSQKFVGDEVAVTVLRDGAPLDLTVSLSSPYFLVPPHLAGGDPSYVVFSGLVFTTLTEPYLTAEFGADYVSLAPVSLLQQVYHGRPRRRDESVVVLSQVLACDATVGYEDVTNVHVKRFNGTEITALEQLARLLAECEDRFCVFELDYDELLVLDRAEAAASTAAVLAAHNIPDRASADMRAALAGLAPGVASQAPASAAAVAAGEPADGAAASGAAVAAGGTSEEAVTGESP